MFRRIAITAATAAALGLTVLAGATTASASSVDDQFLTNIDAEGIAFDSARAAISDAHLVCDYIADGRSAASVGNDILDNTDLTTHQAAVFVVESVSAYCPGYLTEIG